MRKHYQIILLLIVALCFPVNAQKYTTSKDRKVQTRDMEMVGQGTFKFPVQQEVMQKMRLEFENNQKEELFFSNLQADRMKESRQLLEKQMKMDKQILDLKKKNGESIKKTGIGQYSKSIRILEQQYQINRKRALNLARTSVPKTMSVGSKGTVLHHLKSSATIQKLDSIKSFDSYMGTMKDIFQYDVNGDPVLDIQSHYDSIVSAWVDLQKTTMAYNAQHRMTQSATYEWMVANSEWQISSSNYFEYDASGNTILEVDSTWDWNSASFVPSYKYEYAYDVNGYQVLYAGYSWDINNSQWIGYNKWEDAFDDSGNDTLNISYNWDYNSNDWVGSYKNVHKYDVNQNQILNETYYWDSGIGNWVGSYKNYYEYTNNLQTLNEPFSWDIANQTWYPSALYQYAYDANQNQILEQYAYWNPDSLRLINYAKYVYAYDANNQEILNESYYWDSSTGTWLGYTKYDEVYDGQGNVLSQTYYNWDSQAMDWLNSYRYQYEYDANGFETLNQEDIWDSQLSEWYGNYKTTKANDAFGLDTLQVNWNWNYSFAQWDTSYVTLPMTHYPDGKPLSLYKLYYYGGGYFDTTGRIDLVYNNQGRRLHEDEYSYNIETGWEPYNFNEYAYDSQGNDTLKINSTYNYTYYLFLPNYKNEYAYDANNNLILESYYYWNQDSNRWEGNSKNAYGYDNSGHQTLEEGFYWDSYAGDWYPSYKDEYAYDVNGNQTLYASYSWNSDYNMLVGNYKYENAYDQWGNNILSANYNWDYSINDWIGQSKYESSFSSPFQMTMHSYYYWNTDMNIWEGQYKNEYSYDQDGVTVVMQNFNWDYNNEDWMPGSKTERLFDYTFNFDNLRQPYWVISQYYYMGQPEKSGHVIKSDMYEFMIKHRLLQQRQMIWTGSAWTLQSNDRFFYSGFGISTGNVSGYIRTTDEQPVESGYVLMYPVGAIGRAAVSDSIRINLDGSFQFTGIPTGSYYVIAIPDTSMYPTALTTYFGDVPLWSDAKVLSLSDGSTIDTLVIHLVIPPVLNGTATLSGLVEEVSTKSMTITIATKGIKGNPVKSASVILIGRNKGAGTVIARTTTDALGHYKFEHVPAGDYEILVDIPGLPLVSYHTVTVGIDDSDISGLDYMVGTNGINNQIIDAGQDQFNVYPNPCFGYVNLKIGNTSPTVSQVKIYDLNGKIFKIENCYSGVNRIDLTIPRGLYIMQINTPTGTVYRKLSVQ